MYTTVLSLGRRAKWPVGLWRLEGIRTYNKNTDFLSSKLDKQQGMAIAKAKYVGPRLEVLKVTRHCCSSQQKYITNNNREIHRECHFHLESRNHPKWTDSFEWVYSTYVQVSQLRSLICLKTTYKWIVRTKIKSLLHSYSYVHFVLDPIPNNLSTRVDLSLL